MAETVRNLRVKINLESGTVAADADKAARAIKGLGDSAEKAAPGLDKTTESAKKGQKALDDWASKAKVAVAAAAAIAAGAVVKLGMDYEKSLNMMQAVSGATAGEMAQVSAAAKQLGNDVQIPGASASDAAAAMTELAKGGLSVEQSMKAARGTLQLATAAQVDGATAAQIQANALNAFSLKGDQAGHVADVLANVSNAASGELTDFAAGLQQSAGVAQQFGISLDDTVVTLGLFAKNGMQGSDAGTSLKTALISLASPTEKQSQALEDLGVKVYDAQGKFVGLRSLTDDLSTASKTMTQEQFNAATATAFGSDAMRAAGFLAKEGVAGYDAMAQAVGRSGGSQELAAAQAQGLNGAWNNLKNSAENAALTLYEKVAPSLTAIANAGADLVGFLLEVPGPVWAVVGALTAVKVLDGPLSSMLSGFKANLKAATGEATTFGGKLKGIGGAAVGALGGPVGLAITGMTLGISLLGGKIAGTEIATHDFAGAIDELTGAIDRSKIADVITDDTVRRMQDAGVAAGDYTQAVSGVADAQTRVRQALVDNVAAHQGDFDAMARAQALFSQYTTDLKSGLDAQNGWTAAQKEAEAATSAGWVALQEEARAAELAGLGFQSVATAAAATVEPTLSMEEIMKGVADETKIAKQQLEFFTRQIDLLTGRAPDYEAAQKSLNDEIRSLADGFKAVDEATAKRVRTLVDEQGAINTSTAAGSKLYDLVLSYRGAYDSSTTATYQHTLATKDAATALKDAQVAAEATRTAFIQNATAAGYGESAAKLLADRYGILEGIKLTEKTFNVTSPTLPPVQAAVDNLINTKIPDKHFSIVAGLQLTGDAGVDTAALSSKFGWGQRENGGLVEHAERGRLVTGRGISTAADGAGPGMTWAEAATGREYYLSMKPSMVERNRSLASDAVAELGGRTDWSGHFSAGTPNAQGMFSASQYAPAPAATSGGSGDMKLADNLNITGYPDVMGALHKTMFKLSNLRMSVSR